MEDLFGHHRRLVVLLGSMAAKGVDRKKEADRNTILDNLKEVLKRSLMLKEDGTSRRVVDHLDKELCLREAGVDLMKWKKCQMSIRKNREMTRKAYLYDRNDHDPIREEEVDLGKIVAKEALCSLLLCTKREADFELVGEAVKVLNRFYLSMREGEVVTSVYHRIARKADREV